MYESELDNWHLFKLETSWTGRLLAVVERAEALVDICGASPTSLLQLQLRNHGEQPGSQVVL